MGNSDSQDSPWPGLGHMWLATGPASKWHFVPGLSSGSPEIPTIGTFATLGAHNFACKPLIEMKSKAKL
jgi:hypothetical protein